MKRLFFCVLMAGISFSVFSQTESRLLRFPAVYGTQVVFTYAGDLYTVDITGGIARKLTSDIGYEMFPRFSPDGKTLAFTGQYDGNTEVYSMPSMGGIPKRLTYTATLHRDDISDRMGPNNIVMCWTPDGKNIVYRSRKQSFNDFVGQLYSVPSTGGLSSELPLSTGGFCSYSPDGKKLAFNRVFREFRTWKYYKGGMADDIRIFDFTTKEIINITQHASQDIFPMWAGEEVYFLSDRDRVMNMFCYNTRTKETRKLTQFNEYDIKFPSLCDGKTIAFENGGYIYLYDIPAGKLTKLTIFISDDFVVGRDEMKDASKWLGSVDISPDGKRLVVVGRGDVFTVPAKEGITRNLTHSSNAHDKAAAWSPDGKWIAFLSDISGEYEIYIQKQDGSEPPIAVTKNADTYKFYLRWSPDSKKILWNDKKLRLQYVDIDTKQVTLVAQSRVGEYHGFSFSPDSKWIVYTEPVKTGMNVIMLYNCENKQAVPLTDDWYASGSPEFSFDGKYIVFTSQRDFNPIYSQTEWNHAYVDMSRIYLIALSKTTASPFSVNNDEVSLIVSPANDVKDKGIKQDAKKDKTETKETQEIKTVIDIDGIRERIVALPISASNYWNLTCLNDKVYYNERSQSSEYTTFKMFDLKEKKETELGKDVSFDVAFKGEKMMIRKGNSFYVIDLPSSPIQLKDAVSFQDMKVWVNNEQEWKQIYDEAWRQMRDFFYVENMHGVDWKKMHDKYAVMLPFVKNRNDLNYLIGELIGELNVGHAYINGGDRVMPKRITQGLLGAKLSRDASGYFKIEKILQGQNWNEKLRSPLTEMGVGVKVGDFIIAVNGISVLTTQDVYSLLVNTADRVVELTVNSIPSEKGATKVYVKPLSEETALYYYNWVQENIRKVNEATKGEVGYIHVPDMVTEGLIEFTKYFYPQLNKKALIIDDRGNGGGNVSPMLIERLQREITRANMARNVLEPGQTPRQMMLGPKVMLVNQYSASDGDLFPYAFKKHQLGKVIGVRTWGGVVGIRGSLPFVDGADLRKPEFASYSADESKWIIEGEGVEPDIWVDNDPYKEYMGIDDQLNMAIKVILEELKNYKPIPPIPAPPDKSK